MVLNAKNWALFALPVAQLSSRENFFCLCSVQMFHPLKKKKEESIDYVYFYLYDYLNGVIIYVKKIKFSDKPFQPFSVWAVLHIWISQQGV